jgi:signal transduction histidine kinase
MRDQWESKESVVHDSLAHILQSCQFLRGFVVCLQGLGRPGSDDMNSCNLNDIVSEVVRMLHKQFAQGEVRFELELAKKLPAVRGNANRLGHAVMNLAMNARDSMPKGGTIHLRTQYRPKHRVVLTCTDTGTGMPADVRKKIFDPFFTTKAKDVGLGMGLHVVREIVEKEHHGTIHVQSAVGEGSRFMLSLPRFLKKEKR